MKVSTQNEYLYLKVETEFSPKPLIRKQELFKLQ